MSPSSERAGMGRTKEKNDTRGRNRQGQKKVKIRYIKSTKRVRGAHHEHCSILHKKCNRLEINIPSTGKQFGRRLVIMYLLRFQ